jgi:hypothetical protein
MRGDGMLRVLHYHHRQESVILQANWLHPANTKIVVARCSVFYDHTYRSASLYFMTEDDIWLEKETAYLLLDRRIEFPEHVVLEEDHPNVCVSTRSGFPICKVTVDISPHGDVALMPASAGFVKFPEKTSFRANNILLHRDFACSLSADPSRHIDTCFPDDEET